MQRGHNALHIIQRKLMESRLGQGAAPGVKNHDGLSTGFDLRIQILDHRLSRHLQNLVHQIRAVIEHRFDAGVIIRSATFHHVAGQRPRTTGKTDQRHAVIQRLANLGNCIDHITQLVMRIRHTQIANLPFVTQRPFELRAFAFGKVQTQSHRIRHSENVGKKNGGIQVITGQRLQRHLTGVGRIFTQPQKATGALPGLTIFR